MEKLLQTSEGDLRRAITYLQSGARLVGAMKSASSNGDASKKGRKKLVTDEDDEDEDMTDSGPVVTVKIIEEISGVVPPETIQSLIAAMQPPRKTPVYNEVSRVVTDIVADGWSANQVLLQLYQELVLQESLIESKKKILLVDAFSEMDSRLVAGADEHLTMLDLGLRISGILAK